MGAHSRGVHLFDNPVSKVGAHSRGALDRGITIVLIATRFQIFDIMTSFVELYYSGPHFIK